MKTVRVPEILTAICLICALGQTVFAKPEKPQTQPTAIFSFPSAARPGATVDVKFFEPGFGDPIGLWCSFPAKFSALAGAAKPGEAKYRITAADNVPTGIYAARLLTSAGVSHLRLLMVDDLPSKICTGGNRSPEQALDVSGPIAIDARCDPLTSDYYRITAKEGDRLSAEVVAQRLGSPLDPMIRLLDSAGHELVYCDDAPGIGADCRFSYLFPADGVYFIEVRDVNYEGGRAYFYRLRLGDFPLIASVSPLAGTAGAEAKFHLENTAPISLDEVALTLPRDTSRAWLNAKYPGRHESAFAPVFCSDLEERVEKKPGDTSAVANQISLPGAISARFDKPGAPTWFEFRAKNPSAVSIRGMTRALGSRAALRLQLLSADGTRIAESKPESPEEASIAATLPAAGVYRIVARELSDSAGPGMFYRLEVREVKPGFSLSVDTDAVSAAAGQSFTIRVNATRRNKTGPIALRLTGDAAGFQFSPTEIPAGQNSVELHVQVPESIKTGALLNFGIEGKSSINGTEVIARASTAALLQQLFPRLPAPPTELDGLIGLGVTR